MPLGLTVASLALATAGIELWGLSVGCAIAVRGGDDGSDEQERDDDGERTTPTQYFVDPTRDEIAQARGVVSMCTMPALGSVTALEVAGSLDLQEINKVSRWTEADEHDRVRVADWALFLSLSLAATPAGSRNAHTILGTDPSPRRRGVARSGTKCGQATAGRSIIYKC